jgi:uncharacterized lipoprotein YddW (UPF0748 family)
MKHIYGITVLAFMLSFLSPVSAQNPSPKRELRGAWIASVASLDWPASPGADPQVQRNQLTAMLDTLKSTGINTVIFQIRPECDALYQSSLEPWSYWLTGVQGGAPVPFYDPLEFAIDEAHARGMELHAWFNPYRAVRVIGLYPISPNHVSVQHPDWILTFPQINQRLLDPGVPQVRDFVTAVIMDVVRRYDVDGVHFDDYFYPYPNGSAFPVGITNEDDATFAAYNRGFVNRGDWRRDNVNLLMRQVYDSIKAVKPFVKFGISPFGIWKNGVPPGISGLDAYSTLYADPIAWLRDGTVDYLTPQLYWRIGGSQDYSKLMPWWADSTAFYGRHHYPGHIFGSYTTSELPNQLRLDRGNPKTDGSVFFRATFFLDGTLGFKDTLREDLYRNHAILPVMAWMDTVAPYPPRGFRYEQLPSTGTAALQWDLPLTAPDGDSASRYVVYRFDHMPQQNEIDDPANIINVEGKRTSTPSTPPTTGSPYYYLATALDRNYNESIISSIVAVSPPSAPVLAFPANNAPDQPPVITVGWNRISLAARYGLQVGTDSTFTTGIILNIQDLTDSTYDVTGLAGQTRYFWKVGASNAGGTGPFSQARSFVTGFPSTPLPVYPGNFMVDVPVDTLLRWSPGLSADSYDLQMSKFFNLSVLIVDTTGLTDTTFGAGPLESFTVYYWRMRAVNTIGASPWTDVWRFRTLTVVSVGSGASIPDRFDLHQNFPNPFNPATHIEFDLPEMSRVTLTVYDILGREIQKLVDDTLPAGTHSVVWNASAFSSGTYFYVLRAGSFTGVKKMVFTK